MSLGAHQYMTLFRGVNEINSDLELALCCYFKYHGLPASRVNDLRLPTEQDLNRRNAHSASFIDSLVRRTRVATTQNPAKPGFWYGFITGSALAGCMYVAAKIINFIGQLTEDQQIVLNRCAIELLVSSLLIKDSLRMLSSSR
jgi:hypothetical protein